MGDFPGEVVENPGFRAVPGHRMVFSIDPLVLPSH
jgi:hypothetical protein